MRRLTSEELSAKFGSGSSVQRAANQEKARLAAKRRTENEERRRFNAKRRSAQKVQREENSRQIHRLHSASKDVSKHSMEDQIRALRGLRAPNGRFLKVKA